MGARHRDASRPEADRLVYLHCDSHASHYLKVMLDDIFGENDFLNEIVWHYRGGGGLSNDVVRATTTRFLLHQGRQMDIQAMPSVHGAYSDIGHWKTPKGRTTESYRRTSLRAGIAHTPTASADDVWPDQSLCPRQDRSGSGTRPRSRKRSSSGSSGEQQRGRRRSRSVLRLRNDRCRRAEPEAPMDRHRHQPDRSEVMERRAREGGATMLKIVACRSRSDELSELKPFEFQNWVIQRINGTHSREDWRHGDRRLHVPAA